MSIKSASIAPFRSPNILLLSGIACVMYLSADSRCLETAYAVGPTPGHLPDDDDNTRDTNPTSPLLASPAVASDTALHDRRVRQRWWRKQAIRLLDATNDISQYLGRGSKELLWAVESPHKMSQYFMNKTATFGKWMNDWSRDYYDEGKQHLHIDKNRKSSSPLASDEDEADSITFPILKDYPPDSHSVESGISRGRSGDSVVDGVGTDYMGGDSDEELMGSISHKMQEMMHALSGNAKRIRQQRLVDRLAARFDGSASDDKMAGEDELQSLSQDHTEGNDGNNEARIHRPVISSLNWNSPRKSHRLSSAVNSSNDDLQINDELKTNDEMDRVSDYSHSRASSGEYTTSDMAPQYLLNERPHPAPHSQKVEDRYSLTIEEINRLYTLDSTHDDPDGLFANFDSLHENTIEDSIDIDEIEQLPSDNHNSLDSNYNKDSELPEILPLDPNEVVSNATNVTQENPDDSVYVRLDGRDRFCTNGAIVFPHSNNIINNYSTSNVSNIMYEMGVIRCTYGQGRSKWNGSLTFNTTIDSFLYKYSTIGRVLKNCAIRLSAVGCVCAQGASLLHRKGKGNEYNICVPLSPECVTTVVSDGGRCAPFNGPPEVTPDDPHADRGGCYRASRSSKLDVAFRVKCAMEQLTKERLRRTTYTLPIPIPEVDAHGKEIRYTVIVNATSAPGNSMTYIYPDTLAQVTNVTLKHIRDSTVVFPYLYQYKTTEREKKRSGPNGEMTRADVADDEGMSITSSSALFYPRYSSSTAPSTTEVQKRRAWQLRHMKGLYFYSQFFNFYHLSDTECNEVTHLFQIGGTPMPGILHPAIYPMKHVTNWTQVGDVLNGKQLLNITLDLKEDFKNDEFFAGGRLYGEFGFDGFFVTRDSTTVIIEISDPPMGKSKGRPSSIPVMFIVVGVVLFLVILAVVVHAIKTYRSNQQKEKHRDSNLLLFDEK